MDWHILLAFTPVIIGVFGFLYRELNMLKNELTTRLTEEEVRIILADKIDAMKDDIQYVRHQIDDLTHYLLNQSK